MKILLLILASALLPTPELSIYKNDNFLFEVQFPKQFQEESQIRDEKFGTIEYLKLTGQEVIQMGESKSNLVYTVLAAHYQTNEAFKRSGMKFQDFVFNHTKSVTEESFLNNNFIILSEHHTKDALNYFVGDSSMEIFMHKKIVIRNDKTYSLSILARKGPMPQEYVDSFFKSLKIKTK